MVHWDARDFITELMNRNKKFSDQIKIKVIQNKCHRLNCDVYLGDVLGSVLMCIFNVD